MNEKEQDALALRIAEETSWNAGVFEITDKWKIEFARRLRAAWQAEQLSPARAWPSMMAEERDTFQRALDAERQLHEWQVMQQRREMIACLERAEAAEAEAKRWEHDAHCYAADLAKASEQRVTDLRRCVQFVTDAAPGFCGGTAEIVLYTIADSMRAAFPEIKS